MKERGHQDFGKMELPLTEMGKTVGGSEGEVWGQVKFEISIRRPAEVRSESLGERSGRRDKQCRSCHILRTRRLDEITCGVRTGYPWWGII